MIVATTQDLALIGNCGCPCDIVICDEPRKECESISSDACGYSLPEHEDLPIELTCLLFAKKNVTQHNVYSFSDETTTINSDETYQTTWQMWDDGTVCDERQFSTTYDETESNLVVIDDETISDQLTVIHLASGIGSPCAGTVSYTDGVDPENSYTDTLDSGCVAIDFDPDGTFVYTPYTYTQTTVDGDTTTTITISYSENITPAMLAEQLARKIALIEEGDPWPESECVSKIEETTLLDGDGAVICRQASKAQKARYRFGVPAGYSTTEAPRSTYEAQWDEVFFPKDWEAWKAAKTAYDTAVSAHDAWEACELLTPGDCGDEPTIPDDPGAEPTQPSLVTSRDWVWGGNMEEPWSEWFEIEVPEAVGETRVVNLMILCYRSSRIGQKPTAYGEVYEIPT